MSVVLDLPPELERELTEEAEGLRVPLPDYIRRIILAARAPEPAPRNGAELVRYWMANGLIGDPDDAVDGTGRVDEASGKDNGHRGGA